MDVSGSGAWLVGALAAAAALLLGLAPLLKGTVGHALMMIGGGVSAGIAVYLTGRILSGKTRLGMLIGTLTREGRLDAIAQEFAGAAPQLDDRIRLGEQRIFMKGRSEQIKYEEVARVFQHVEMTFFVEVRRTLKAQLKSGEEIVLCRLRRGGRDDRAVEDLIACLRLKNPSIEAGHDGWRHKQ